jgi:hypothetical protein
VTAWDAMPCRRAAERSQLVSKKKDKKKKKKDKK